MNFLTGKLGLLPIVQPVSISKSIAEQRVEQFGFSL